MSRTRTTRLSARPLEDRLAPAVFAVNNLADANVAGTLRWAINQANALPGPDTIDCSKVAGVINLKLGELPILEGVTVLGPGASVLTINGGGASRIFNTQVAPAGSAITFSGLTLTGGKSASTGGAIAGDDESISLRGCVLIGNTAATHGAGISLQAGGSLIATDSRFLSNIANGFGGGIHVAGGTSADARLYRCTVANNYGAKGAGVYAEQDLLIQDSTVNFNKSQMSGGGVHFLSAATAASPVSIRNSTVSGNSAPGIGGGLALENFHGELSVYNSTFSQNSAQTKGGAIGVVSGNGRVYLESSILQGDNAPVGPEISAGEVRYRVSSLFNPAGIVALVNLGGNLPFFTDCKLGPLANNGGPTQTHRLNAGSPAINTGSNVLAFANDQRGAPYSRTKLGGTDIGAYERQGFIVVPTVTSFTVNGGSAQRSRVTSVRITFSEAVSFPQGVDEAVRLVWTGTDGTTQTIPLDITVGPNNDEIIIKWKLPMFLEGPEISVPDGKGWIEVNSSQCEGSEGPLDGDGDGDVDATDYGAFRQAFGSGDPIFINTFDFDGDGDVDAADYGQMRQRFGTSV
jgi:hypothetical protein